MRNVTLIVEALIARFFSLFIVLVLGSMFWGFSAISNSPKPCVSVFVHAVTSLAPQCCFAFLSLVSPVLSL